MTLELTRNSALLGIGLVLLLTPALFPVQPMLYHYPDPGTTENESELRRDGYEIVAYENLSDRGQQLYRRALREGSVAVPPGEGATDFDYPTGAELGAAGDDFEERRRLLSVVIERPPDLDLPPPAEPVEMAEEIREERRERRREAQREREGPTTRTGTDTRTGNPTTPSIAERRETIGRYDLMTTRTELPPVTTPASLARLLTGVLGVFLLGVGGYRTVQP